MHARTHKSLKPTDAHARTPGGAFDYSRLLFNALGARRRSTWNVRERARARAPTRINAQTRTYSAIWIEQLQRQQRHKRKRTGTQLLGDMRGRHKSCVRTQRRQQQQQATECVCLSVRLCVCACVRLAQARTNTHRAEICSLASLHPIAQAPQMPNQVCLHVLSSRTLVHHNPI